MVPITGGRGGHTLDTWQVHHRVTSMRQPLTAKDVLENNPNMHVSDLWEETREPEENPHLNKD